MACCPIRNLLITVTGNIRLQMKLIVRHIDTLSILEHAVHDENEENADEIDHHPKRVFSAFLQINAVVKTRVDVTGPVIWMKPAPVIDIKLINPLNPGKMPCLMDIMPVNQSPVEIIENAPLVLFFYGPDGN